MDPSSAPLYSDWRKLGILLIWVVCATPAAAQIDSEPSNNTTLGANALSLTAGDAISNRAKFGGTDNDVDFFSTALAAGDVLVGMTTPLGDLPDTYDAPDTIVSVLAGGTQQTFSDDDLASEMPAGLNRGSLFRFRAATAGTYHIGVTGFNDYEFDGSASSHSHDQIGPYFLTAGRVNPAILGGGFADTDPANNVIAGADAISIGTSRAAVAVSNLPSDDVDFYKLNLSAGQIVSAMTAPLGDLPASFDTPDTLLGLFASNGQALLINDDAGDRRESELNPDLASDAPYRATNPQLYSSFGSVLRAQIPADGVYYLGVTGSGDHAFRGFHDEAGRYALLVGVQANPPLLPGDLNEDGTVNSADYVIWRRYLGTLYDQEDFDVWKAHFGESTPPAIPGDFNKDGSVNSADYVVWRRHLGTIYDQQDFNDWRAHFGEALATDGDTPSTTVPEPSAARLLLMGTAIVNLCLRRAAAPIQLSFASAARHIYYLGNVWRHKIRDRR